MHSGTRLGIEPWDPKRDGLFVPRGTVHCAEIVGENAVVSTDASRM